MDLSALLDALTPVAGIGVIMLGFVKIVRYWSQASQARSSGGVQLESRLESVEQDLAALHQELTDTQERLDFAERLLAQSRESKRLPE